jgi:hypothetical protein
MGMDLSIFYVILGINVILITSTYAYVPNLYSTSFILMYTHV